MENNQTAKERQAQRTERSSSAREHHHTPMESKNPIAEQQAKPTQDDKMAQQQSKPAESSTAGGQQSAPAVAKAQAQLKSADAQKASVEQQNKPMESKNALTEDEAKAIGGKLGMQWDTFPAGQFRKGIEAELSHREKNATAKISEDDLLATGKIALAHLNEFPDYYDRLEGLEKEVDAV